ncbi:MAG TPA: tetratricopeptide repeat protein, partial [Xanthomonadaceae bacterium]|nr:tetratricopeptide repeat protein [Xanthomonadaceae bacterium]
PESRRAWTLIGLGSALTQDGQPEAAMDAFAEGEAIAVRTLGAGHAMVAQALLGSSYAARDLGRPELAEQRLRRALEIAVATGDEAKARVRAAMGELCLEQGRPEEAIELLQQGLADLDRRGEGRDPQTLTLHTVLALALARAGRPAEALAESEPAISVLETLDVARGRWLGEAALSHAEVLLHAGRLDDAARWRKVGESELESVWPGLHPRRLALLAERMAP